MFYSDNPIQSKDNDKLNRTEFSKQLAKAILSYTKLENFTISLCGRWGSGKTSILNMVVEEIEELSKGIPAEEKPVIVTFNPWNYSDCTQLLNQFFQTVRTQLGLADNKENLSAIGNALQKYSSLIEYTTYIPKVGQFLGPLKSLLESAGAHLGEIAEENSGLTQQKEQVIEELKKQKQKIIVMIDDIDRLTNEQIRLIFQLVNTLAGFPNMIYLLSFDRSVVVRALEEEQNCDGEEYLEKIIQVLFEVPTASGSSVNRVFSKMFADIIFEDSNPDLTFDREYWDIVFPFCISPFIKTIRDAKRIVNAFEFKHGLIRGETNCVDLLAVTTLQVCAPEIYNWIRGRTEYLTGSAQSAGSITGEQQRKNCEEYLEMFRKVYPKAPHLMLQVIQTLFPKFAWNTNGYPFNHDSDAELRRKQKIASKDRIKRYFGLSLEETEISHCQIQDTLHYYSAEQLRDYFLELESSNKLCAYLHELLAYIPELSVKRRSLFIEELIKLQGEEKHYQCKSFLDPTVAQKSYLCVREILRISSAEENHSMLKMLIENVDTQSLPVVCDTLVTIESGYGKIGTSPDSTEQHVTEKHLCELESALIAKIKKLSETSCLLDCRAIDDIYRFWGHIDKESWDQYIALQLKEVVNIPKYLALYAHTWRGGKTNGWNFEEASLSQFVDIEDTYEKILRLKNTADFSALQHRFKQLAVAFCIWHDQEVKDRHGISEPLVNTVILDWEKQV